MTGTGLPRRDRDHDARGRWVRLAVLPPLVAAALVLAACSSGSSGSSGPSTATSASGAAATSSAAASRAGGAFGQAFEAYRACLSKNGVTLPSPSARTRPSGAPSGMRPSGAAPSGGPGGGFRGGFGGGGGLSSTAPSGVDQGAWKKAYAACASLRPSFTPGQGGFGGSGAPDATAIAAYVSCLKDHGLTVSGADGIRSLDRSDPKVAAAMKTCAPLRPSFGARPSMSGPAPAASSSTA